ncbi:hypothetical protein JGS39_39450 [Streptomyces sp. P01-B04]|uniref:hypothetical protein n=1 Tax=Streptomyces poriferorum TaxID=2798799 RepID=UPI001C5E884A|nr:hypothetical protein [Streptomyces poriferorum]MBW5254953.1 hypothetical protein [Streptomyces poriferorum]MBW5262769.1 hypothetical protein [Streptomyces poriferorum]
MTDRVDLIERAINAFAEDLPYGDVIDCDTRAMAEFVAVALVAEVPAAPPVSSPEYGGWLAAQYRHVPLPTPSAPAPIAVREFRPCADCRTPFRCEEDGEDRCP